MSFLAVADQDAKVPRCWGFTLNNPVDPHWARWLAAEPNWNMTDFGIKAQLERGGTSGTLHLQGLFYARRGSSFRQTTDRLSALFGKAVHIKELKTKTHANRVFWYVEKIETAAEVFTAVDGSERMYGVFPQFCAQELRESPAELTDADRAAFSRRVSWLYGPPGSGKTTMVDRLLDGKGLSIYRYPGCQRNCSRWLGNYDGQDVIIVDEFDWRQHDPNFLKLFFDEKPQVVPAQMGGRSVEVRAKHIFVMSNHEPWQVCDFLRAHPAIHRRMTLLKHVPMTAEQQARLHPPPLPTAADFVDLPLTL